MKTLTLLTGILFSLVVWADNKNELSVLGGHGAQKGFTGTTRLVERTGKGALVDGFKTGFVGGVQYKRFLGDKLSVGIQVQTNDTISGVFGVRF